MGYIDLKDIKEAKQGSVQAIEKVFRKYNNLIKASANRWYSMGLDKDDLIQEAMIGLHKAIQDFDEDKTDNFTAFAKLCVTRRLISAIKMANRQKHRAINEGLWKGDGKEDRREGLERVQESPETKLLEKEDFMELLNKLQTKLSGFELEVLLLSAQGLSYKTIGEKLNVSSKAVDNSLQRTRRKLTI